MVTRILTFLLLAHVASAVEYIHLDNLTDVPFARPGHTTAIEHYAEGVDPNDPPFGPSFTGRFVPVAYPAVPTVNAITENLVRVETTGLDDRVYWGNLNGGTWEKGYVVNPKTLEQAKQAKQDQLALDAEAALAAGFTVGQFTFPYTEEFFNLLANRSTFLETAIAEGDVIASQAITFSDVDGREVSVNLTQIKANFSNYGVAYLTIKEKEVAARNSIRAATTLTEVDAVTWTF